MSNQDGTAELRALCDLIKSSVDSIAAALASRSQTYPSANEPFSLQSEASRMSPDILEPGRIIVSAAAQLIATVRLPVMTLAVNTTGVRDSIRFHVA